MRRRTWLQSLLHICGAFPFLRTIAFAQSSPFTPKQSAVLGQLAALVLRSALGDSGTQSVAEKFERYVREYRPGADTDHGYGFTHVAPKPPSPAGTYAAQLDALPSPLTREAIQQSLRASSVKDLPRGPEGKNVVADLMSFYFRSTEANDLCYMAHIGRDECIGLAGTSHPPAPLRRPA